jgi:hypothetical protein
LNVIAELLAEKEPPEIPTIPVGLNKPIPAILLKLPPLCIYEVLTVKFPDPTWNDPPDNRKFPRISVLAS